MLQNYVKKKAWLDPGYIKCHREQTNSLQVDFVYSMVIGIQLMYRLKILILT